MTMNTLSKTTFVTAGLVALLIAPSVASAQTEDLKDADVQKKAMAKTSTTVPNGWKIKAKVGLSGNLGDNNANAAAAGAGQEGTSFQIGLVLGAQADFKHGQHGWENKLNLQHAQTKTPSIDSFIKTQDNLELISTYVYRLNNPEWLGPFGRFKFQTQVFKGYAVRDGAYSVDRTKRDKTTEPTEMFDPQAKIPLTGAFEPMILRETAGMFARPFTGDSFKLDGKLGVGAQHIVVRNGYVVTSEDAAAGTLLLKQLDDVNEAGAELELLLEGVAIKDILSWKLGANFFLPIITSADDPNPADPMNVGKANGFGFLNTDIQAGLSLKIAKYASLDYNLQIKKVPLVVDGFQVIHGLVLSAGFDIL